MAALYEYILPTDVPLYEISAELDGRTYRFRFDYQAKSDRFFLSIYTAAGDALRRGIKVIAGWNVLRLCRSEDRPPGVIYFLDLASDEAQAPALRDLGRRVRFFYVGET